MALSPMLLSSARRSFHRRKNVFSLEQQELSREISRETELRWIPLDQIESDSIKLRPVDRTVVEEMSKSARGAGIMVPIEVRQIDEERYRVIFGEHRLQAAIEARLDKIKCIIRDVDEIGGLEIKLIENLHRNGYVDPVAEGQIYKRLVDEKYHSSSLLSVVLGKSPQYVSERISIWENLLPQWKEKLQKRRIVLADAVKLSRLSAEEQMNYNGSDYLPRKRGAKPQRRSVEVMLLEMLEQTQNATKATHLMYTLNVSWNVMQDLKKALLKNGLLNEDYSLTKEGADLVSGWKSIHARMKQVLSDYD